MRCWQSSSSLGWWAAAMAMMMLMMIVGGPMATALPDGFRKEVLTNARSGFPTEILFSPDGRTMYFSRKNGRIQLMTSDTRGGTYGNLQMALNLTLETCTEGERGLGDIALHPDFSETDNRWMYVYHTVPNNQGLCSEDVFSGAQNVLVRYAVNDDMTLDASSRELLLESPPLPKRTHNGGSIQFGVDGLLYVTIGDGDIRQDAPLVNNLLGGIIRLTPEGDIPDTNPFVGDPQAVRCHTMGGRAKNDDEKCVELYAVGLRNPFKMSMDPNSVDTVRFMVNDVGARTWEEMSIGGEEAPTGPQGLQDFGWPRYEGACLEGSGEPSFQCGPPAWTVPPFHFFRHDPNNGGAAVGSAWIPDGVWPTDYEGGYLYSDFVNGQVNFVTDLSDAASPPCYENCGDLPNSGKAVTLFEAHERVIVLKFGPYGECGTALYMAASSGGGQVLRIIYEGDDVVTGNAGACGNTGGGGGNNGAPTPSMAPVTPDPTATPTALELAEVGGYPGPLFEWSSENCPLGYDYCGMLEFCQNGDVYGFRLPCTETGDNDNDNNDLCECKGMFGPLIRVQPGNKYQFILRNASPDISTMTNIHPHGLHIVGDGDGDDVMRKVHGGGNCLDYTWDIRDDHPGGTYWYHSHHHGTTQVQVEGGAFGMFIVEDNLMVNPDTPAWATNERLLQVYHSDAQYFALGNGKNNEVIDMDANQWYRLRVSMVDSDAIPHDLIFVDANGAAGCTIHKVASDGIWRSTVPGPTSTQWEMTGASRGDFAVRCTGTNQIVPMTFNGLRVATIRISNVVESNPFVMEDWSPARPYSLRDLRTETLPEANTFSVRLGYDYVNDVKWDPITPIQTIAFDQVHEWTIQQTSQHPFHLHLYHMQVVQPGGCGPHEEGEWYDTISAPEDCLIRFATSDFGQRCILHCHVYFHEDAGSMSWVNVTGPNMPLNEVQSFEYQCPAFLQAPTTPAPQAPQAPIPMTPSPTTMEPTSTPCRPGFLGLQSGANQTQIVRGAPYINEEYGVFASQNSDGNFVVFRGRPGASGERLFASQSVAENTRQNFHASLETDGQLAIYEDVPEDPGDLYWTNGIGLEESSVSRVSNEFFLGVDCTLTIVSVYQGTPENPGPAIWNSIPTNAPTISPTRTPTIPATNVPTGVATPLPTVSPSVATLTNAPNTIDTTTGSPLQATDSTSEPSPTDSEGSINLEKSIDDSSAASSLSSLRHLSRMGAMALAIAATILFSSC